eukprot:TRINITY_DN22316_c0_g6_i1.p1 TRINITY_DN22316_c0_g6~~TRINITY_DN22316_c0_g6_i1.p1  ORF type:complete len:410 (+),score=61.66 TRINITY_DN22316_c0_g6_i1:160-1230(+)
MARMQKLCFIEKPKDSPRPDIIRPLLLWEDDNTLVIGWADTIKIVRVSTIRTQANDTATKVVVEIIATLTLNYYISGIAPYANALVVLAYMSSPLLVNSPIMVDGAQRGLAGKTTGSLQQAAERPEVRIVTWKGELLAVDALPVKGYEDCRASDYSLVHLPFSGSCVAGAQWAEGDEPLFYIVAPRDVVLARPRNAEDHVDWLLERGLHDKALMAVESTPTFELDKLDKVGGKYLDHLFVARKYAQAASLCPKLLRGSPSEWEKWIFRFSQLYQLHVVAPYVPTASPRLNLTVYKMILESFVLRASDHRLLLTLVQKWPTDVYSVPALIDFAIGRLGSSRKKNALLMLPDQHVEFC